MKLERTSVSLISVVSIIGLAIAGAVSYGALSAQVDDNKREVEKTIPPLVTSVQKLTTAQAVLIQRMKTLEKVVTDMKRDQKDGFKRILDKLDKKD